MSDFKISREEAEGIVTAFLDGFFGEIKEVVDYEVEFLQSNGLEAPAIDYFKLKRFIETAVRNLKAMDHRLLTGAVYKLYKDAMGLYSFYFSSVTKTAMPKLIFEKDFLKTIPQYKQLEQRIEALKSQKNTYEIKMRYLEGLMKKVEGEMAGNDAKRKEYNSLKLHYAEATHYFASARDEIPKVYQQLKQLEDFFSALFLEKFDEYKSYNLGELKNAANSKLFYLDKLMWHRAERSPEIRRFFKEADIKGAYEAKTFINYYLKNIDIKKTYDKSWHTYLQEILDILE